MRRPWPSLFRVSTTVRAVILVVAATCALFLTQPAQADDAVRVEAFHQEPLPVGLQPALPHTPQPFPGEGDLEFERQGPSGWVLVAALLGTGAAVSGLVALASHARMGSADTQPADVPKLKRTRNDAAYVALGLAGGAGVALVIQVAK